MAAQEAGIRAIYSPLKRAVIMDQSCQRSAIFRTIVSRRLVTPDKTSGEKRILRRAWPHTVYQKD